MFLQLNKNIIYNKKDKRVIVPNRYNSLILKSIMNGTQDPDLNVKKLIELADEYVEGK